MKKNYYPYDFHGSVKVEEHDDREFVLGTALQYVVDDYAEYLGSVEQSYYGQLDYYEVIDFAETESDTLDLRWMKPTDTFDLKTNEYNKGIKRLLANIDNLGYSRIPSYNGFNNIELVVNSNNTETGIISRVGSLSRFLRNNKDSISTVSFQGFGKLSTAILEKYVSRYITKEQEIQKTK